MQRYCTAFIFILTLVAYTSTPFARSNINIPGCPITLEVVSKNYSAVLGQGFTDEAEHFDLVLKLVDVEPSLTDCESYQDASQFKMNAVTEQHPDLSFLKKGDLLKGGIEALAPNPRGKFLHEEYLHRFFITYTVDKKWLLPDSQSDYFKSFNNIGVFKD